MCDSKPSSPKTDAGEDGLLELAVTKLSGLSHGARSLGDTWN